MTNEDRLREVAQILIEEIGATGQENVEDTARRAVAVIETLKMQANARRHAIKERERGYRYGQPDCFICGEPLDNLAANPGLWAVHLGNDRDAHIECVNEKLRMFEEEVAYDADDESYLVVRGGSWCGVDVGYLRASYRLRCNDVGFRCAQTEKELRRSIRHGAAQG